MTNVRGPVGEPSLLTHCSEAERARLEREVNALAHSVRLGEERVELIASAEALEAVKDAPASGRAKLRLWAAVLRQRAAALPD